MYMEGPQLGLYLGLGVVFVIIMGMYLMGCVSAIRNCLTPSNRVSLLPVLAEDDYLVVYPRYQQVSQKRQ